MGVYSAPGGEKVFATAQVPRRSLNDQRSHAGEEAIHRLKLLARPLRGLRVLNITVSPFGTGVAELLPAVVPLLRDLGVEAEWQFVGGDPELSRAARKVYDGLSGRTVDWDEQSIWRWLLYNRLNSAYFEGSYDVVVIHEPQPTALLPVLVEEGRDLGGSRWVWHCHLDLRRAQSDVWESLRPILRHYDACVFSHPAFQPPDAEAGMLAVIPPVIDPANIRNAELSRTSASRLLASQGVDSAHPVVVQVAPFAESFGPIMAIDAVRRAREKRPDIQLALIQPSVEPTPEAWSRFEEVARYASRDPGVRTIAATGETASKLVNAAQRLAGIVMQASVPGGFSLPLWEAMWKGRPVVVGASGGLPLQIEAGVTGLLARDEKEFAESILSLLSDQPAAATLGAAAREHVRRNHLLTRFLEDELRLFSALLSTDTTAAKKETTVDA